MISNKNKKIGTYIILFIFALLVSLRGCTSILNNSNYFSTDVAVWMNIAEGMKDGKVIYSQMFDHKGPILYFIYFIGSLIGDKNGIWFIDILCNFINAIMIYKIANKFITNKKISLLVLEIIMLCFAILYNENPCTESLALPFILISLSNFIDFILSKEEFSKKESLITGLCLGIVLFIRPNLITLWIVYYLFIFFKLIKDKDLKRLFNIMIFSLIGLMIVCIPIVLYCLVTQSLKDMIKTYIIFNMKYAKASEGTIKDIFICFVNITKGIILYIPIIHIVLITYLYKDKNSRKELTLIIVNLIFYILSTYIVISPKNGYLHYAHLLIATAVVPLLIIVKDAQENKRICTTAMIVALTSLTIFLYNDRISWENVNMDNYRYDLKQTAQYVNQYTDKNDNVLQLGNETNFYLLSNRKYKGKYFYQLPVILFDNKIANEFIRELKEDLPAIIVDYWGDNKLNYEVGNKINDILKKKYTTENNVVYVRNGE